MALWGLGLLLACNPPKPKFKIPKVEVKQAADGSFSLLRDGQPYFIKGAGGHKYLDKVAELGGNSIRLWGEKDAEVILDQAHEKGLSVCLGLWVGHERHGFDYNNAKAVQKQLAFFRKRVIELKDHPGILLWAIGNEVDLAYTNTKVWEAINDLACMIKELDPNHPTMTVTAGLDSLEVQLIQEKCPCIDIYGINTYGGLERIPQNLRNYGWEGPYIIGEWGPTGHWETDSTTWEVPIEETSWEKAQVYKKRYESSIALDTKKCLGSYVFYWGNKQETTPTWYGIFLESGEMTEVGDAVQHLWTGSSPQHNAPRMDSLLLEGSHKFQNVHLKSQSTATAKVFVTSTDSDLTYRWEILPESTDKKMGGDAEAKPKDLNHLIHDQNHREIELEVPEKEGPYRLLVYVIDSQGKAATANVPFYVN